MPKNINSKHPRKVNFQEYEHAFSYDLLKDFEEGRLDCFDMETMRGLIYGYTFTEDYAKGIIPDALNMDYWKQKDNNKPLLTDSSIIERYNGTSLSEYLGQGPLLWDAIWSSGDGTLEKPYCVICVQHEYEFLNRHCVFGPIKIIGQRLLPGHVDCIDIEGDGYAETIFFDISRWFERVKL